MEYRYRNVKTKEVIVTSNKVSGAKWEPVEEAPPVNVVPDAPMVNVVPDAPVDMKDDQEVEADLATVEEAAEKPKATRRKK